MKISALAGSYKISRVIEEAKDTISILFNVRNVQVFPGQFLMVWIPREDEIPLSVSYMSERYIGVTVRAVGDATRALCKSKVGDVLGLRGPYGNGFTVKGERQLLVGGGIGAAPIKFLAEFLKNKGFDPTLLLGFRTKGEVIFKDLSKKFDVQFSTDDGSFAFHGFVTELVEEKLKEGKY